jgi:hypothetical protein
MNKINVTFIILALINFGLACYTANFSAICGWLTALLGGIQLYVLEK